MSAQISTVSPLMKVGLKIKVTPDKKTAAPAQIVPFNFFYGIGSAGISLFEKLLTGKSVGEEVTMRIGQGQLHAVFGHLACAIAEVIKIDPPWALEAVILSIEKPADRDLVRAMAQMSSCGSGCDCGCGG